MAGRRLLPLAPVLTLALFILSPVLAHAGAAPTMGACCTGLACSIGSVGACDGLGGSYQGNNTTCTLTICGPVPPLNHFQCYDVARTKFDPLTLDLTDDFGTSAATARRAKMLCAPVNKNAEDPNAPDDADHFVGYEIRRDAPRFAGLKDELVEDQFGTLLLDLRRPERLLVPSAKSVSGPALPLDPPVVDHYQCYRVRGAQRRVAGVMVEDQFGADQIDVKKPLRLCVPVDKNGEGIVDAAARLMCYQTKPGPRVNQDVWFDNQFDGGILTVRRARELCVPAATPTTTGPTPTATMTPTPTVTPTVTPTPTPSATATPVLPPCPCFGIAGTPTDLAAATADAAQYFSLYETPPPLLSSCRNDAQETNYSRQDVTATDTQTFWFIATRPPDTSFPFADASCSFIRFDQGAQAYNLVLSSISIAQQRHVWRRYAPCRSLIP